MFVKWFNSKIAQLNKNKLSTTERPRVKLRVGKTWLPVKMKGTNFKKRWYANYEDYLELQKQKILKKMPTMGPYQASYHSALKDRLVGLNIGIAGKKVLCLGARMGAEVKAFLDLDAFAVGIDLNPGPGNPYVLCGDFHELQFPSKSVQIIFTNSFDHSFDAEKVLSEIKRVLEADGVFILEAVDSSQRNPGFYESFWWDSIEDLIVLCSKQGFKLLRRIKFDYPWPGETIIFQND